MALNIIILLTGVHLLKKLNRKHCCVSVTTMVMRRRNNIRLDLHSLTCYVIFCHPTIFPNSSLLPPHKLWHLSSHTMTFLYSILPTVCVQCNHLSGHNCFELPSFSLLPPRFYFDKGNSIIYRSRVCLV